MDIKNQSTIPGASLASTIKVLAGLGPLGEKVLKQSGISEIDSKKNYPSEIRLKIFDEVYERFGEDALYTIGIEQGLLMLSMIPAFGEYIDSSRKRYSMRSVSSNNRIRNLNFIEDTLPGLQNITNDYMKQFRSKKLQGKIEFTRLSENTWQMSSILAQPTRNWPFGIGNYHIFLLSLFGDMFQIDYQLDHENSQELDEGWSEGNITITFSSNTSLRDYKEVIAKTRFEAHEKLLKAVLEDAENQKEKTQKLSSNLAKYLPPQIHEAIFSGKFETGIATKRKKLTIFFSDIANFTSTSEGLQPEDLTKYLNEYFSEMTAIALECGATIDKYIGDAMMVFFGDPDSKGEREDARACVNMALQMRDKISDLQLKWQKQGFSEPFQVRMGMNTGYCNVGNFGSDQRLTYTIIGSEVNVAQRLETSAESGGILMSYETYAHAQDLIEVEQLESISMKGVNREIKVFSVLNELRERNKKSFASQTLKTVPERIGDRLDALEAKIEEILVRIK
ncbi:adenylate/guanylate cyclase domain-containing protein [Paracoccaceae bacterium]|nr:adenylate/guanylate cyclase domain-containing protein [Paracoccaceae bacterium]